MSDRSEDSLQTEEIEAQVAALLREIDLQAEAVEARMRGGDDAEPAAVPSGPLDDSGVGFAPAPAGDLDDQINQLISAASPPETQDTEDASPAEPADVALEDDSAALDAEVEALLEDSQGEASEVPADPSAPDDPDLSALTAELATEDADDTQDRSDPQAEPDAAADPDLEPTAADPEDADPDPEDLESLLHAAGIPPGETDATTDARTDPEVPEAIAEGVPESIPDPLSDSDPAPVSSDDTGIEELDAELAAQADVAIEGEIETVDLSDAAFGDDSELPVAAPTPRPPTPSPGPAAPVAAPADEASGEPAAGALAKLSGFFHALLAIVLAALRALSRPLDHLSPRQRDTLGWMALNVLFLALCVWLVLVLR